MKKHKNSNYDDIGYTVDVYLAMSGKQAIKYGCKQCLFPRFPESERVYGQLRDIDNKLCVSKQVGWTTVICLEKQKIDAVLDFLYPEGIPKDWDYKALLKSVEGNLVWIIGFDN